MAVRGVVGIRMSEDQRALTQARADRAAVGLSEQIRRDVERANSPREWLPWEHELWERIARHDDADKLAALRREQRQLVQLLSDVTAAIQRREDA